MARAISYFVFSSTGSYLRWDDDPTIGFSINQYQMSITGGSSIDRLYAGAKTQVDATGLFASAGVDQLYFSGSFGDYTQTVSSSGVYTFTGMAGGAHAGEVMSFSMTSSGDTLVFADRMGTVQLSTYLNIQTNSFATILSSQLAAGAQTNPATGAEKGNAASKVFVFDSGGIKIPQLPIVGEAIAVTGGSGADSFYVRKGTNADATGLFASAGIDVLYLTGKFGDYRQAVSSGGVYTFTRTFTGADLSAGLSEVVSFSLTSSGDKLVFADGGATLQLSHYLVGSSFAMILATDLVNNLLTPGLLTTPTLSLASDTGVSASDNLTSNPTINVMGLVASTTWQYQVDTSAWQTGTGVNFTASSGAHSYFVRQTDTAGNTSPVSAVLSYILDTSAPSAIAFSGGGASISFKENSPSAVGTLTANANDVAANASVTWSLSGADARFFTVTSTGVLSFITPPNFERPRGLVASATNTDTYTVNVIATDAAGNAGTQAIIVTVQDQNEPPVALGTVPNQIATQDVAYSFNVSRYFSEQDSLNTYPVGSPQWGTLTYTTSNTLPSGLTLSSTGLISGTSTSTASPVTITITATDGGGLSATQTFSLGVTAGVEISSFTVSDSVGNSHFGKSGDTLTFTVTMSEAVTITDGTPSITFTINGQSVTASYSSGAGSATLTFTAPAPSSGDGSAISVSVINLNGATVVATANPARNWDHTMVGQAYAGYTVENTPPQAPTLTLANDTGASSSDGVTYNPTINVSGLSPSATWQYQVDGTTAAGWLNGTGASFTASTGAHSYFVRQSDAADNISGIRQAVYTLDTTPPSALSLSLLTDTGSNTSDGITRNANIVVSGITANSWQYQVDGGSWMTGTGSGFFATRGGHTYAVQQIDLAGNISPSTSATYTLLNTAPDVPSLALASDTGTSSSDKITSNPTINVGSLVSGGTWQYQVDGTSAGSWMPGSGTSFTATTGAHSYFVRQIDIAGNNSTISNAYSVTLDTTAPATPSLRLVSDSGNNTSDGVTNAPSINVLGLEAGATWQYQVDGTAGDWSTGSGTSFTATTGTHSYFVRQTDIAGNLSNGIGSATYTLDTLPPTSTRTTFTLPENTTAVGQLLADEMVTWAIASGLDGSLFSLNNSNLSFISAPSYSNPRGIPLSNTNTNTYTINVTATDIAGNASTVPLIITVSDLPTVVGVTLINAPNTTLTTGGILSATVTTIEDVTVTGTPQLALTIGNQTVQASYTSGSGSSTLRFTYIIQSGQFDSDGVSVAANSLTLNGGAIYNPVSAVNLQLTHPAVVANPHLLVDTISMNLGALANGNSGFMVYAQSNGDLSGTSVASAGDVNADGYNDFIIGAPNATGGGKSYIVFGKANVGAVYLSAIAAGSGGFVINAEHSGDSSGHSVSAVGDVNGDGLADFLIGSYAANGNAGKSYVVFGKKNTTTIELSNVANGSGGFVISGQSTSDDSAYSVAAAGDTNGDGYSDLIIGAYNANGGGKSYVIFGKNNALAINLNNVANGSGGYVINGQASGDKSGYSVSSAGDINGDGYADLIIGAPNARNGAGAVYVVWGGTANPTTIALSNVVSGTGGFAIYGISASNSGDQSGYSVAIAGDVNGDGYADIIIGAPNANSGTGASYVVFGNATLSTVNLSTIAAGSGGFVINGQSNGDKSGSSVSFAGDINGDGLADLIISSPNANNGIGKSYVVFGKTNTSVVNLYQIAAGTGGFALNGENAADMSGTGVATAGDINGDGYADLIVGAPGAGKSYVLLGSASYMTTPTLQGSGTVTSNVSNQSIVGSTGNDTLTNNGGGISRFFAGVGNDTIVLTTNDINNLVSNTPVNGLRATIDGGSGIDTLRLSGGAALDLTAIANIATVHPSLKNRISNIERIDLATDTAANSLTLSLQNVLDIAGFNNFNTASTGWSNVAFGTALESSAQKHQLVIDGSANDTVFISGWTQQTGLVNSTISGTQQIYNVYNNGNAQLFINSQLSLPPSIARITLAAAPNNHTLVANSVVSITITTTQAVSVSGIPQLALTIGNQIVQANYAFGSGTNTLLFTYTIPSGMFDSNGISIAANSLKLNAGTITSSSTGVNMGLQHSAVADNPNDLVDSISVQLSAIAMGTGGFVIHGQSGIDLNSGSKVSIAGDVNGDGLMDLIVGSVRAGVYGNMYLPGYLSSNPYVVFGKTNTSAVNLSSVVAGTGGFVINGDHNPFYFLQGDANSFVAGVGDINGDGLADIIVANNNSYSGQVYAVFGKTGTAAINLQNINNGDASGFLITAADGVSSYVGFSVSAAGDVNGDGLADLLIGAPQFGAYSGKSYVVFGKADISAVDLISSVEKGTGGFVIIGPALYSQSGYSVSSIGDINGDGLADFMVGTPSATTLVNGDGTISVSAGTTYVVLGKKNTSAINLTDVGSGTGGFVINGIALDNSGGSISGVGDVNGDGYVDFLICSPYTTGINSTQLANAAWSGAYVVFGNPNLASVNLNKIMAGTGGFVINPQSDTNFKNANVASAGDFNGDGLADLLIGVPYEYGQTTGVSYVIFGKTDTSAVNLSAVAMTTGGFAIVGGITGTYSGTSVSSAGDVNGDGYADLIIGEPGYLASAPVEGKPGDSYVIFGAPSYITKNSLVQSSGTVAGTTANEAIVGSTIADTLTGGGGIDRFFGGAGNDIIVLTASDITNLGATASQGVLSTIDGGAGIDSLRLAQGSGNLDLTSLSHFATGDLAIKSRITSIERIDLASDTSANTLTLNVSSVQDITGMNNFNSSGNGGIAWSGSPTGWGATVAKHQIVIDGSTSDILSMTSDWVLQTGVLASNISGVQQNYTVYNSQFGNAQVIVNNNIKLQPWITGVSLAQVTGGVLKPGDIATVLVNLSRPVTVQGSAQIALNIGGQTVMATYASGSTFSTLNFTYTVQAWQFDLNGISIPANSLTLTSGSSMVSTDGLNLQLNFPAVADNPNVLVNGFTQPHNVALGSGGFIVNGNIAGGESASSVSVVGDVNGDGLADFIVGAPNINNGASYVVFGKADTAQVNLGVVNPSISLGFGGFAINRPNDDTSVGYNVSAAGDVNGDGLADVIIGIPEANGTGASYVVFGKANNTSAINLSAVTLGTGGFVINGASTGSKAGFSVSAAGDVNGDGLADLVIGANGSSNSASYVVFGKTNGSALSLSSIAAGTGGGFIINAQNGSDQNGYSVSSIGDINGDGLSDLIVSSYAANNNVGAIYVVFGKANGSAINLSTVASGSGGFIINGSAVGDETGCSVSAAGDVNGDGLADFIVGAFGVNGSKGASYVVFGKNDTSVVNVSTIVAGTGGFVIYGQNSGDQAGYSVSAAGDFNGDGLADVLIGAPKSATGSGSQAGRTYLVFGKTDTSAVNLGLVMSGGFVMEGETTGDHNGSALSAGDVNGDGFTDLVIGSKDANNGSTTDAGKTYTIFGSAHNISGMLVQGNGTVTGTVESEAIVGSSSADILSGGGGVDRFFGGAGNDTIVLTASDITNLSSTTPSKGMVSSIDGGTGIDTLRLSAGAPLDLTAIANIAMGNPNIKSRITSIERIDLATDSLANLLTFNVRDVLDMAGMNSFNTGNGWSNAVGSAILGASQPFHQLVIDGTTMDRVSSSGWQLQTGTVTSSSFSGSHSYNVYNSSTGAAQLLVDVNIIQTGILS